MIRICLTSDLFICWLCFIFFVFLLFLCVCVGARALKLSSSTYVLFKKKKKKFWVNYVHFPSGLPLMTRKQRHQFFNIFVRNITLFSSMRLCLPFKLVVIRIQFTYQWRFVRLLLDRDTLRD